MELNKPIKDENAPKKFHNNNKNINLDFNALKKSLNKMRRRMKVEIIDKEEQIIVEYISIDI